MAGVLENPVGRGRQRVFDGPRFGECSRRRRGKSRGPFRRRRSRPDRRSEISYCWPARRAGRGRDGGHLRTGGGPSDDVRTARVARAPCVPFPHSWGRLRPGVITYRNMNRLVTVVLREFVARRKARAIRRAMAEMVSDPAIQSENAAIAREFAVAEGDGLYDVTAACHPCAWQTWSGR